jgi:hypothetical protein
VDRWPACMPACSLVALHPPPGLTVCGHVLLCAPQAGGLPGGDACLTSIRASSSSSSSTRLG